MLKRVEAKYRGMVQGIGFRFTAQRLAEDLDIKGWVKNMPDGSVELAAEAEEENLGKFLEQIKAHFKDYIQDADLNWKDPAGRFQDFRVAF